MRTQVQNPNICVNVEHGQAHAYYSGAVRGRDERIPGAACGLLPDSGRDSVSRKENRSDRTFLSQNSFHSAIHSMRRHSETMPWMKQNLPVPQSWTYQPADLKIKISICRLLSLWSFLQQPKWTKMQAGLMPAIWLSTRRVQHGTLDIWVT